MVNDIRLALRCLRASPGSTVVALVTLTLAVGVGTAIFSVVDAVALRGLPFERSDRLVSITTRDTRTGRYSGSNAPQDYLDWSDRQSVFSTFVATGYADSLIVDDGGRPRELRAYRVTAGFFDTVRVRPRLGSPFTSLNYVDDAQRVVILSDVVWRRQFGADPDVVGRAFTARQSALGQPADEWTVLGVMPPDFTYPLGLDQSTDVWVPLTFKPTERYRGDSRGYYLQVIGRLKDGVTVEEANRHLAGITAGLAALYPTWFTNRTSAVRPLHEALTATVRPWLWILLGAVTFLVLLATANLATLMLARGIARLPEVRVRAALGASRWRISQMLLVESLVLSLTAAGCALIVAWWGIGVLRTELPPVVPRLASLGLDLRVFTAAMLTAIAAGIACGLVPAWQFSRPDLGVRLRDGGRGVLGGRRLGFRYTLVIGQVCLAAVLLVGAGLFVASFVRLIDIDLGIDPRNVVAATASEPVDFDDPAAVREVLGRAAAAVPEILDRVRSLPGVEAASFISGGSPLSGSRTSSAVQVLGRDETFEGEDSADVRQVTPEYLAVMRTPLRRGRYLDATDRLGAPRVAVINEEAARRYFGSDNPLGARIRVRGERTVVGVVGNVRLTSPEQPPGPEVYVPIAQDRFLGGEVVVRTRNDSSLIAEAVGEAIRLSWPGSGIPVTQTMSSRVEGFLAQRKFLVRLAGLFSTLTLLIAAFGVYGVMGYLVTQRRREIGLRLALGARPLQVQSMVLGRASVILGAGLTAGVGGAWLLTALLEPLLFEVRPHDLTVFGSAVVALVACGFVAAWAPARRAARTDPLLTLRSD